MGLSLIEHIMYVKSQSFIYRRAERLIFMPGSQRNAYEQAKAELIYQSGLIMMINYL